MKEIELNEKALEACRDALMNMKLPASSRCPICGEPVHVYPDYTQGTACLYHLEQRARLFGDSERERSGFRGGRVEKLTRLPVIPNNPTVLKV